MERGSGKASWFNGAWKWKSFMVCDICFWMSTTSCMLLELVRTKLIGMRSASRLEHAIWSTLEKYHEGSSHVKT